MIQRTWAGALVAATCLGLSSIAGAEVTQLTIARQFGLGYLPLHVMEEQRLIEKYASEQGLTLTVTFANVGSTSLMADGLLSGQFHLTSAGVPPFLVVWDRTRGGLDVKLLGAVNEQPMKLNTSDPQVKSLKDLSAKNRIAVPAIKTSAHSILLAMAAKKEWGDPARLEALQVPLAHPSAVQALLSNGLVEVDTHFATIPFIGMELADPRVRTILTSTEILGGPATIAAIWGSSKFKAENPKVFGAVMRALKTAVDFVNANHTAAAQIYIKVESSKLPIRVIEQILADPDVAYSLTPRKIMAFADHMFETGQIKKRPASWKDLTFAEIHDLPGG